ncbi:MAG TPA: RNA polymerase factor sigma-32 [Syntrophorhabdaceae bacterium]|nr:RNA polymerase factor sigma-32 [Syntrophorhabdaceae bacterium]MDI9559834.1 RNA polymerase factor sigma-32 [Pseudomonadota bacterium]OQC48742.1 MAG: RNA polymerase sigma factor RpoH [Deltaproteobacteria bacterium ADurb.Bin026]MBV6505713.1 RNA polymerase sigma factor RpoH [Syntrophorhabdaceae bacterium]HOB69323.1 RNA polymerase factor sigma-32 [Syntrophorhabdaceae bacterium]
MTETFLSEENSIIQEIEDKSLPIPFDPLKKYLAEISKHPVLSREEEYELAEKIHKNKDIEAAQKMVISNLKLVVKIALEYYNTYLNILDLIQEGNVGLLHAVKKYNPYRGTKFSTYASFWIRAYILKYIMDSWSLVKIGTTQGQRKLFYRLNKEKQKLEALGVFPAPQLLASTLDVTEEEVESMQKRLAYTDISLETPVHEEGDDTLMDMIKTGDNVEEIVTDREMDSMLSERVAEFKKDLNEKELFIFEHRIMTDESMTLQEIGEKFKISRERVRQIENKVLNRFKARFKQELKELDF